MLKPHYAETTYWVNPDNGITISDRQKKFGHRESNYPKFSIECKTYEEMVKAQADAEKISTVGDAVDYVKKQIDESRG